MASSDSTSDRQWKYDVFLSFRGVDTGKNFTDHLYTALDENGFYAFRDDEKHEKGQEIAPEFLEAIGESKISIVVFSKKYASSRWCLDELETIVKSMKERGCMVVPVFYHVDPSEVRNQTGSYGKAFFSHERDADEEEKKERVKRWRAALREASSLVGWHLQNQYESQLIKEIITDILRRLNCELLQVDYDTVGMEFRLEELLKLIKLKLDKVRTIGIYGISGIGKTTIAKAILNEISHHFQNNNFYRGHDLNEAEFKKLIDDKRVLLVVVDDVDQLIQVEYLLKLHASFSHRSRIILTTRDRHLLNVAKLDESYDARELTHEEAIHLLSWHAFKQTFPKEGYVELVNYVVGYAKGHPLALKVLGSSLFGKTIPEWERILPEQGKSIHGEIFNVLKVSFDGLTPAEQEIFLKVVCLLKGKDEEFVSTILDSLTLGAASGIQVLHDRCLVTISNNKLYMHDLLQQMGQKIIYQSNPRKLRKRGRLQDPEDVYPSNNKLYVPDLLQKMGQKLICESNPQKLGKRARLQGPEDMYPSNSKLYMHDFLQEMGQKLFCESNPQELGKRGRLQDPEDMYPLKRNKGTEEIQRLVSSAGFQKIPKLYSLKHLDSESLPPNIPGDHLTFPNLSCSNIRQLWKGYKILGKLKFMDLSHCQNREKISKFSSMPALKILTLKGCKMLRSLPSGISELESRSCLPCPENDPFSSVSRGFDIFTSGIQGIPEWTSYQMGCAVKTELPMNWYEHKGFLGLVLCSVYVPLDAASCHESDNEFDDISLNEYAHPSKNEFENSTVDATHTCCLECKLIDQIGEVDFLAFGPTLCECYFNGGPSKQVWIRYYPKVTLKKKYFSNERSQLTASFKGYHNGTPLKVKECGINLIYDRYQHYNLLAESLDDAGPIEAESDSFEVGQQPCLEG